MEKEALQALMKKEGNSETFTYKGFDCKIKRNQSLSFLCGYVRLPEGHKFYKQHYNDIDVDVHGSLTYSQQENDQWVVGFDCGHCFDLCPFEIMVNDDSPYGFMQSGVSSGTYRTMEYVESEIKKLVDQL